MVNPLLRSQSRYVGRKRRLSGCLLAICALLALVVWGASSRWWFRYRASQWDLQLETGSLTLHFARYTREQGFDIQQAPPARVGIDLRPGILSEWGVDLNLWLIAHANKTTEWGRWETWQLSFWPVPLLFAIPSLLLLRSASTARRRARTGLCPRCGYGRAGLTDDAACPECGPVVRS